MVDDKFIRKFYENKPNPPMRAKMGGFVRLENFPKDVQAKIKQRLRDKDPVLDKLAEIGAVGVKVDGKLVNQEWADQLNIDKPEIKRDDGYEFVKTPEGNILKHHDKVLSKPKPEIKVEKPKVISPEPAKLVMEKPKVVEQPKKVTIIDKVKQSVKQVTTKKSNKVKKGK